MNHDQSSFLIAPRTTEIAWEWHLVSDTFCLSPKACEAFELSEMQYPKTIHEYIAHIPDACVPVYIERRESVLNGLTGSILESSYPFDDFFVREFLLVVERDAERRATRVIGSCIVSKASAAYCSPLTRNSHKAIVFDIGYWSVSLTAGTIQLDTRCANLLGYTNNNALLLTLDQWQHRFHPDEGSINRFEFIAENQMIGDALEDTVRVRTEKGEYHLMLIRGSVVERDAQGKALYLAGTMQIANQIHNESEHEDNGQLLRAINVTGDGLWDWDATTNKVYYNSRYLSMLGYTLENFPGTLDTWKTKIHPDDFYKIITPQADIVASPLYGDTFECTYRILCHDGTWAWILGRGYVTHRDDSGKATRLVGTHTNITAVQNEREHLENLVKNDAVTGLRSRTYCELEMERIEKSRIRPVSVVSCDINGLKLVNDYLGHAEGDKLLAKAALLLRYGLRATDCIARMGGDEFVLLFPMCTKETAETILEKIIHNIVENNKNHAETPVFIAFGLSCTTDMDTSLSHALADADRSMLRTKAASRKSVQGKIKHWIENNKNLIVTLTDERYAS